MIEFQSYTPNNNNQLIMSIIFYAFLIVVTFFSFSSIYVLFRNGRSRGISFFVSVLYLIFYLSLATQGIMLLNKLS